MKNVVPSGDADSRSPYRDSAGKGGGVPPRGPPHPRADSQGIDLLAMICGPGRIKDAVIQQLSVDCTNEDTAVVLAPLWGRISNQSN